MGLTEMSLAVLPTPLPIHVALTVLPIVPAHLCSLSFPTDVPVERLADMAALRCVNLRFNPLSANVRVIAPPLIKFDLLMTPEGARAPPP